MRAGSEKTNDIRWLLVGGLVVSLGGAACEVGSGSAAPTSPRASATNVAPASATLVRLSNRDYDDAVQELLGVPGVDDATLPVDTTPSLGEASFPQYFAAADALGEQVWSTPELKSRVLSCTPTTDATCTRHIVTDLASRAWHGPTAPADVDRLTKVATDAVALGETPTDSIKQVVKSVLASPQFLYQVAPTL